MFINKDSIVINGISMGDYITEATYEYNKLWGSDSGRNLAGKMTGTLVGIFPKIVLKFKRLTKEQTEIITPILDAGSQTVSYYDPTKKRQITMTTYTGDYKYTDNKIIYGDRKNSSFECSFISTDRRA